MRRLTALIKKIIPFPAEVQTEFFKIAKVLHLLSGEWVPDDLAAGTFIFVEEGFLLLTRYQDNLWKCTNVYLEGTLAGTFSEGAPEMQEGSFRVRATEPSRIYYLTTKDMCRVEEIFPRYTWPTPSFGSDHSGKTNREQDSLMFHPRIASYL